MTPRLKKSQRDLRIQPSVRVRKMCRLCSRKMRTDSMLFILIKELQNYKFSPVPSQAWSLENFLSVALCALRSELRLFLLSFFPQFLALLVTVGYSSIALAKARALKSQYCKTNGKGELVAKRERLLIAHSDEQSKELWKT